MRTPLDMLIGPALRQPQGPQTGEVPGSEAPGVPWRSAIGMLAVVAVAAWAARRATR